MKSFLQKKVTSFTGRLELALAGFAVSMIWLVLVVTFLKFIIPPDPGFTLKSMLLNDIGVNSLVPGSMIFPFVMACISAPIWEELAFRVGPAKLAQAFGKQFGSTDFEYNLLFPIFIIASCIFGWGHGGPVNIWIQGIDGAIMAIVYIKSGYAWWTNMMVHFMLNFTLMFAIPMLTT